MSQALILGLPQRPKAEAIVARPARSIFIRGYYADAAALGAPFRNIFLGPAYPGRVLAFGFGARGDGGGARTFSGVTLGTRNVPIVIQTASNAQPAGIAAVRDDETLIGTVTVSVSGTFTNHDMFMSVYHVVDFKSPIPIFTAASVAATTPVNTAPGSVGILSGSSNTASATPFTSPSGAVVNYQSTLIDASRVARYSASRRFEAAAAPHGFMIEGLASPIGQAVAVWR